MILVYSKILEKPNVIYMPHLIWHICISCYPKCRLAAPLRAAPAVSSIRQRAAFRCTASKEADIKQMEQFKDGLAKKLETAGEKILPCEYFRGISLPNQIAVISIISPAPKQSCSLSILSTAFLTNQVSFQILTMYIFSSLQALLPLLLLLLLMVRHVISLKLPLINIGMQWKTSPQVIRSL